MTFAFVVAARPNDMKIAPILAEWTAALPMILAQLAGPWPESTEWTPPLMGISLG